MKLSARIDEADRRWLQQMSKKFGAVVNAAFVGVVTRMKNRMAKSVANGGGLYGIPTFAPRSPITEKLHGPRWGGQIPQKSLIRYWRKGGKQIIGFPDNNPATVAFGQSLQIAEFRAFSKIERRYIHRHGFRVVGNYDRPRRPVIDAFAEANAPDLLRETRARVEKILSDESKIQKINARARKAVLKQLARKR